MVTTWHQGAWEVRKHESFLLGLKRAENQVISPAQRLEHSVVCRRCPKVNKQKRPQYSVPTAHWSVERTLGFLQVLSLRCSHSSAKSSDHY